MPRIIQLVFVLVLTIMKYSCVTAAVPSHPKLFIENSQLSRLNVIVTLQNSTSTVLESIKSEIFVDRFSKIQAIASRLQEHTLAAQSNVLGYLQKEQFLRGFSHESLWATNQIIIWRSDWDLIYSLADSFAEVERIEDEKLFDLLHPVAGVELVVTGTNASSIEKHHWGMGDIDVAQVWANYGTLGSGVVVATIDTGVRHTHEALRANFVGEHGWYSPANKTAVPQDANGHGTHTMGTIVGTTFNIGASPGSKWMSCQGCHKKVCSDINILLCGQWMICPTKTDGSHADCSKAPHVVSNSWGASQGNPWFSGIVRAWQAIGIIPVFAAGNSGPKCGTLLSPGDYDDVISVGATTKNHTISSFSSVGPKRHGGRIKPEIAAPGHQIVSASFTSDQEYAILSGTSMACPHAAGVVALLLSKNPDLTFKQVREGMMNGSVPTTPRGEGCDGLSDDHFPNYHSGSGRISAAQTFQVLGLVNSQGN